MDGLTGFEFFAEFRTTIDYQARTITFSRFDAPWTGIRIPFYSDGHTLYIEGAVEGHSGVFGFDTGSGATITIFPEFARRVIFRGALERSRPGAEASVERYASGRAGCPASHRAV